ncbi:RNA polymerase sigma-70 factor [Hymenobacter sp. BT770]|uniref:RNA polymerase sigma-70 factor n=1 Tax=Hymenobacter sp. BT770 TaxID=2886942 RepID=UPI001D11646A|nr:RNA polymerase sigma-70 factor [Hymenobacter sp. BT770]MCC3155237.1 RNA polymerase sigma-70 factor [Hymenobacter sp. BT770]MDO3417192.1 RNA polymerase sigma-70 factor [Hymenobacter sp. BT770]
MAVSDDAALNARLTQLRQSDPAAFIEQLFKTFYAPLGAVVYRVVPDRAVVEDILQDVFLRLWQGLEALPAIESYRAYLNRMALNAALRHQQRAQRQVAWDDAPPATAPVAPDALAGLHAAEAADAVAAALAQLPPQCRLVFELSRYEEMSYQQIAEALEISPKTVENQMGKALRIMRRELAGVLKNLYGLLLYGGLALLSRNAPAAMITATPNCPAAITLFLESRGGNARFAYLLVGLVIRPDLNPL